MKLRIVVIVALACAIVFGSADQVSAQQQGYDISSGGLPTITGGLNASVTGTSDVTQNLTVTINFGEVSTANPNSVVKVVVPIAVRSRQPYQVTVSMTGSGNVNPQAIQLADIGFGVNNMRQLGNSAQTCTRSTHQFKLPFANDPVTTAFINTNGRVAYQSSLTNISGSTVILSGPKLTQGTGAARKTDDGWAFDAIFVITPQYFAAGSASATLTFSIAAGPNVQC